MAVLFGIFQCLPVFAEKLEYRYRAGEKYRIISEVDEDVYINGMHSHYSKLLNRISVEVRETGNERGLLFGRFETSERSTGKYSTYEMAENYESLFWRDRLGYYTIDKKYFMPVVRDVPVFPDRNLKAGDTWSAEGYEAHDFRESFKIPEPYLFPITVSYQYLGKDETALYDLITIRYTVFHRPPPPAAALKLSMYPVRVTGYSSQILRWDNAAGRPHSYSEDFAFVIDLSTGDSVEYTGTAKAEVVESEYLDRDKVARELRDSLDSAGFGDVGVAGVDEGVKITIENIQFQPDSAELAENEEARLRKISEALLKLPGRDIVVTGHTALAGTEEGRMLLSLQRAKAVAEYLLSLGAREEKEIRIQGKGGDEPVAENSTEEGRSRNRRVEITILEN